MYDRVLIFFNFWSACHQQEISFLSWEPRQFHHSCILKRNHFVGKRSKRFIACSLRRQFIIITMNYHHFIILFLLFFEFDKIQAWTRNILTQTRKYKTSFMTTDYRAKSNEVSDFRISQHSRREWLIDIFKGSFMGSLTNIKKVLAAEMPASMSLCDPSISTLCHPPTNRIVHIIGTAHISTSSAALASQVVKEIRPNAVFIEVSRIDCKVILFSTRYCCSHQKNLFL